MNQIMNNLFQQYNFVKLWEENKKIFFGNTDKKVVSYFILNFIDCTNLLDDEKNIKKELNKLEEEYIDKENGIKNSIIKSLNNKQDIAQLDKNISAIYLVKLSETNVLAKYRHLIYSIEESPNYFKRYILPYTEKQAMELKDVISDYSDKNIIELLSDLVDEEEGYYALMNGKNHNSVYELVVRLFAKIPFLQYKFKTTTNDMSLEKMINDALEDNLIKYDEAIRENRTKVEELIEIEKEDIWEKEIDEIFNEYMKKDVE